MLAGGGDPAQLLPAREQMAFTLGFHIVLVPFGVAFTFLMLVANYRGIRRGDAQALRLAEHWSKVAAVLFSVGAVSGTVLSFELGLLWPGLMGRYGGAYGLPFSVEGFFFFIEAIFVAIYIYGWSRMRPWPHFWSGVPVTLAGLGGTASVVAANAWMNQPGGITVRDGKVVNVDPWQVFFNGAFWYEALHMFIAAYVVAGFVVAGVYAAGMLKGRRDAYHLLAFRIAFTTAAIAIALEVFVGDLVAREVFNREPAKFAAIELLPDTSTHVPEVLGGVVVDGKVRYGLPLPDGASLLAGFSPDTRILGLNAIPVQVRPPDNLVTIVHLAFDTMVGSGTLLFALAVWYALAWWRRRDLPRSRWFLRAATVAGVLSVVSLEAGWVVTEVGRQPWTVAGLLLTRDAVTTSGNVWVFFTGALVIYLAVGIAAILVLRSMRRHWAEDPGAVAVPYGPDPVDVPYGPDPVDAPHGPDPVDAPHGPEEATP
jgi:cytochrome d ubiquinol oxidase subunit I